VSRNLTDPKYKDSVEEKEFCKKVAAFIELFYEYAEDNGGKVLTSEKSEMFFSRDLEPEDIGVPLFVAHQKQHRPKKMSIRRNFFLTKQPLKLLLINSTPSGRSVVSGIGKIILKVPLQQ
jgi:hypothetical protein